MELDRARREPAEATTEWTKHHRRQHGTEQHEHHWYAQESIKKKSAKLMTIISAHTATIKNIGKRIPDG